MKEQLILGTEEEIQRELNLLYEGLKNGMSINAETAHRMFSGLLLQLYQTKLPKSEKDTIPENADISMLAATAVFGAGLVLGFAGFTLQSAKLKFARMVSLVLVPDTTYSVLRW